MLTTNFSPNFELALLHRSDLEIVKIIFLPCNNPFCLVVWRLPIQSKCLQKENILAEIDRSGGLMFCQWWVELTYHRLLNFTKHQESPNSLISKSILAKLRRKIENDSNIWPWLKPFWFWRIYKLVFRGRLRLSS